MTLLALLKHPLCRLGASAQRGRDAGARGAARAAAEARHRGTCAGARDASATSWRSCTAASRRAARSDPRHDRRSSSTPRRRWSTQLKTRARAAGNAAAQALHAVRATIAEHGTRKVLRRARRHRRQALAQAFERDRRAPDALAIAAGRLSRAVPRRHRRPHGAAARGRTCACASTARSKRACNRSTAWCWAAWSKASGRRRRAPIPGSAGRCATTLGLDLPERRIGLSAHDFAQALGAQEVILTRAAKLGRRADGRLALRAAARRGRGRGALERRRSRAARTTLELARALDEPAATEPVAAARAEAAARRAAAGGSASPRSRTGCAIPTRSTPSTC